MQPASSAQMLLEEQEEDEDRSTFEMLDPDADPCEDLTESDRWKLYCEKYETGEDTVSSELKEQMAKKPVFLPRNVRTWWEHAARKQNEGKGSSSDKCPSAEVPPDNLCVVDGSAQEAVGGLLGLNAEGTGETPQCRFDLNSYKMRFVVNSESYFCNLMALQRARQSHLKVSLRLNEKFRDWHKQWIEENVTSNQEKKYIHVRC